MMIKQNVQALIGFENLPTELLLLILYILKNPKYFSVLLRLCKAINQKLDQNPDKVSTYWTSLYREHFIAPTEEWPLEILKKHRKKYNLMEKENNQTLYMKKYLKLKKKIKNLPERQRQLHHLTRFGDVQTIQQENWQPKDILGVKKSDAPSPLYLANKFKRQSILTLFFTETLNKADTTLDAKLLQAVMCNIPSEVKKLIAEDHLLGIKALNVAIFFDHLEVVIILLNALKVKINIKNLADVEGCTPLFVAVQTGNTRIVEILLEAGVDVNEGNIFFPITPLCIAAGHGYENIVRILIKNGANVDRADSVKITPLYIAVLRGHTKTVRALLEGGASITQACPDKPKSHLMMMSKQYPKIHTLLTLWQIKAKKSHLSFLERVICILETSIQMTMDPLNNLISDLKKQNDEKSIIEMIKRQNNVVPKEKMEFLSKYIFQERSVQVKKEISLKRHR